MVELGLAKAMVAETFATYVPLGHFTVRDMRQIQIVVVVVIKKMTRKCCLGVGATAGHQ